MISLPYQVSVLKSRDIRAVNIAFDWLIANLGTVLNKSPRFLYLVKTSLLTVVRT